jgi:hypothetical protein
VLLYAQQLQQYRIELSPTQQLDLVFNNAHWDIGLT